MKLKQKFKILLLASITSLTACSQGSSDKNILCGSPLTLTEGNISIINKQCLILGENKVVALLEIENKTDNKHYVYTMNVIDGSIVLNLTTEQAIILANKKQQENTNDAHSAMMASMMAQNYSRRYE